VNREADADTGPGTADLLQGLEIDLVGLPRAALLLRIGHAEEAELPEHPEGVARETSGRLVGRRPRGQLGQGEVAGGGDDLLGLGGGKQALGGHQGAAGGSTMTYSVTSQATADATKPATSASISARPSSSS
jgi:hypothetical protein